jgi:hypothetical protein
MGAYMDRSKEQGAKYQDQRQAQGDEYQGQREAQGDEYQKARETQGDQYADEMTAWGDAKADWQRGREQAIQGAEGRLKAIFENYGRAFKGSLFSRWAVMGAIILGLLVLIVFFQQRKDVV